MQSDIPAKPSAELPPNPPVAADASLLMRALPIVAGMVLCLGIGSVFGAMFRPGEWYAALNKPFFNPPNWLFAPTWTLLYILMGIAVGRIWRLSPSPARTRALRMFAVQLALNASWTPVFFGAHSLTGGLAVILCMALAIIVTVQHFHPLDRLAAWLLAPYLAWVAFASLLNMSLLVMNGNF